MPGVRVTVLSQHAATPYSGMIPGFLAGHYSFAEAHVDLRRLCHFAGAAFARATVTGLDLENKRVLCAERPPVSFDLLSLNTGSTPSMRDVPGASEHALPIKPIAGFLRGWERILQKSREPGAAPLRIAVVGGGAGGVEMTLATQYHLRTFAKESGAAGRPVEFHLLTDSAAVLPTHNARVQAIFARILRERGVRIYPQHRVVEVRPGQLICQSGESVAFDELVWTTHAAAPPWIGAAGLQTDANGFLAVNDRLQSRSHPFVFGAGDVAAVQRHPRPKSGVFAVRQGPPLAKNLRRALAGRSPRRFRPQKNFLSLISTGDQYAVASRGAWAFEGRWLWRLKNWIDQRWMRKYQDLPVREPAPPPEVAAGLADAKALREISKLTERCGGCGAKVGSSILSRVLKRLTPIQRGDVLIGLNAPDDAAVMLVPEGQAAVQTVDFLPAFTNDPYLFGRIVAAHSLSDVFAMGASPQSALAIAVVPAGLEAKIEEQLFQMMSGAVEVLNEHGTQLAGGHTTEGAQLALGLVVNGVVHPDRLVRKGGLRPGDQLILTKPLGTGSLFAAEMRGRADADWIETALVSMQQSNCAGARLLLAHQATACTDVTGFGLLGHLVEMLNASPGVGARLDLATLPLLPGAQTVVAAGLFSSLQPQNLRLRRAIANLENAARHERYPLLFDPQTSGGLLAGVPASRAATCLDELRRAGYEYAAIIGTITAQADTKTPITLAL